MKNEYEWPIQYAEPEPEFGFDWVDWVIIAGTLAVFFALGFAFGKLWS